MTAGADTDAAPGDRLDLADWRRQIADLYSSVRAEALDDPESAWEIWREAREQLFRKHPQSPVPARPLPSSGRTYRD